MSKAPQPSPWGIVSVVAILAFLIWLGPIEDRLHTDKSIQHGSIDCNQDPKNLSNIQLELCMDITFLGKGKYYE